jgi:hypothetical protein
MTLGLGASWSPFFFCSYSGHRSSGRSNLAKTSALHCHDLGASLLTLVVIPAIYAIVKGVSLSSRPTHAAAPASKVPA